MHQPGPGRFLTDGPGHAALLSSHDEFLGNPHFEEYDCFGFSRVSFLSLTPIYNLRELLSIIYLQGAEREKEMGREKSNRYELKLWFMRPAARWGGRGGVEGRGVRGGGGRDKREDL